MARHNYFDTVADPPISGEKRGRKKRATAHRIFKSAIELMQADGFHGVSVEQICDRAGIARATFFQHFSSKAELMGLFSDIVRQRIEVELAETELSPLAQLRLIADHLQAMTEELGDVAPDMIAAFTATPGGGFRVEDTGTGMAKLLVGIIRQGQMDGSLSKQWSVDDIAISLVSCWVGLSRHRLSATAAPPDPAPSHTALDLLLSGISSRSSN